VPFHRFVGGVFRERCRVLRLNFSTKHPANGSGN